MSGDEDAVNSIPALELNSVRKEVLKGEVDAFDNEDN